MPSPKTQLRLLLIGCLLVMLPIFLPAQEGIKRHRKGELIVLGNPGEDVKIEQLSHEFWFGEVGRRIL